MSDYVIQKGRCKECGKTDELNPGGRCFYCSLTVEYQWDSPTRGVFRHLVKAKFGFYCTQLVIAIFALAVSLTALYSHEGPAWVWWIICAAEGFLGVYSANVLLAFADHRANWRRRS